MTKEYEKQLLKQAKENIKKMLSKHIAFGEEQDLELQICQLLIKEVEKYQYIRFTER